MSEPEPRIYRIIRYYRKSAKRRTIKSNVTLTVARLHCSDPRTSTAQWFDGYDYMKGCKP